MILTLLCGTEGTWEQLGLSALKIRYDDKSLQ